MWEEKEKLKKGLLNKKKLRLASFEDCQPLQMIGNTKTKKCFWAKIKLKAFLGKHDLKPMVWL